MTADEFFRSFHSATNAPTGNQLSFFDEGKKPRCGRVYFRTAVSGTYRFSLLFSNTVEATFKADVHSPVGTVCAPWHIFSCRVAVARSKATIETAAFTPVLFDGKKEKDVTSGDFFATDPVLLTAEKGDTLCVELCYQGTEMPYHKQLLVPAENKTENGFVPDVQMPVPLMVGCDRPVRASVAFWGDSITQGVGTEKDAYEFYSALLGQDFPDDLACHNLGIGGGTIADAATLGPWFQRALASDYVSLCFGVNDILRGAPFEEIKENLSLVVRALKKEGKRVFLQAPPPFDYKDDFLTCWQKLRRFLSEELSREADGFFDPAPVIGAGPGAEQDAPFGAHPNGEGHRLWAEALKAPFTAFLQL